MCLIVLEAILLWKLAFQVFSMVVNVLVEIPVIHYEMLVTL